jgi:dTDP-L-rhamnose 4-epimerase
MGKKLLITGGAGFIGSHLGDELLKNEYSVRVLDNLSCQVHGVGASRPEYLASEIELQVGDVRDPDAVRKALEGVDAVVHLAANVGVGQSMYQIEKYTNTNNLGTAVLLEALIEHPVQRLVVASSMSIYGEGLYRRPDGKICQGLGRTPEQLQAGQWEVMDEDGGVLEPVPTPETKVPVLASVYALSKYDQERMCLMVGQAYKIPTTALRLFNVFGPRQALSNPYTGVLAIFSARLLNDQPPMIFEDGYQRRDFVSVYDVARAFLLAMEVPQAVGQVFNIGGGRHYNLREVAHQMNRVLNKDLEPEITGKYRVGDIRHCFADIRRAREVLGYTPAVTLEDGLEELAGWLDGRIANDNVSQAHKELAQRGLAL